MVFLTAKSYDPPVLEIYKPPMFQHLTKMDKSAVSIATYVTNTRDEIHCPILRIKQKQTGDLIERYPRDQFSIICVTSTRPYCWIFGEKMS